MSFVRTIVFFLFVSIQGIAQSHLSDSLKTVIKLEFSRRKANDNMKAFPDFFRNQSDSLVALRKSYIQDNFLWLIDITKQYGFPSPFLLINGDSLDKRRSEWITFPHLTIFHILQSEPELLLTEDVIELFSSEIKAGRLERSSIRFHDVNNELVKLTPDQKRRLNVALEKWGNPPLAP